VLSISADLKDRAKADLFQGILRWRIWWLLGIGDIRQRYSRSRFGQFWITLSTAIFVVAIGLMYALIFKQPIREFLPYVAVNIIIWTLIAGIINESATIFTQSESFLRQEALPKTLFVMRLLVRNIMSFAHNVIIIPLVFLAMGRWPSGTWLLAPVGLFLILVAGFFMALLLGVLCTRFRDMPQIVQNFVQIAFFLTPVMWPANTLRSGLSNVVLFNPFAAFLHVAAEPLLGAVPSGATYLLTGLTIAILAALSLPLFARFRARIVYWL
jgi:ABC-type polysaccharide/polyol phosphate export permease